MCPRLALIPTLSQRERERKAVFSSFDLSVSSGVQLVELVETGGGIISYMILFGLRGA